MHITFEVTDKKICGLLSTTCHYVEFLSDD